MEFIFDLIKKIIPRGYDIKEAYEQENIHLTQEHLVVIQNLHVAWLNIENGAIAVYFPRFDEVAKILKKSKNSNELKKIMSESLCAFSTWLSNSSCLPGTYFYKDVDTDNKAFFLTEHHIKLIHLLIWRDMKLNDGLIDFYLKGYPLPLPYTDGKRPFGERVDYKEDIIEFLGADVDAENLFRELDKALHVYLRNAVSG